MSRRDVYQDVTDRIVNALEQGTAPWVRPWDATGGSAMPCNLTTDAEYRGINVPLLWIAADAAGYASNEWATYKQARGAGGQVRKGEKGTHIVFFKALSITERATDGGADKKRRVPMIRSFVVYNRAQIDGLPEVETFEPKAVHERDADAEAFVRETSAEVIESSEQTRAFYSPKADRITMPGLDRFKDSGSYYATLLHELTHWTGHEARCARSFGRRFGSEAYAAEELVAEMGAAFLCAHLQIPGEMQHPEYIASWIKVLKGDKRAIVHAASKAREATEFLRASQREAVTV
jgi:antirestriction protein ArdC